MAVTIMQALDLIYENVKPTSIKIIPIEEALGYVLAQDVVATHNLPPYDNSAMDGYAVKLEDAGSCVKVSDTIFAGDNSDAIIQKQSCIKIMTGAKIPKNSEAIVPIEDVTECKDGVILPKNIKSLNHIRFAGEDIKKGEVLLKKSQKLDAHKITLLASQGISHIKVHKKPRIAIFASGAELKMHFENVEDYQLYNTNTPTFFSRAKELDCEVEFIGTAQDSLDDLKEYIKSALDCDFIITSGGVSVGDADYTKEAFSAFEHNILFDKVEIKPGKPTTFGFIKDKVILNLPGNPLAAALNFELFGRSIILALSGSDEKYLHTISAKMQDNYKIKPGRRTLLPGYFNGETFKVCDKFAPGMISPLAKSNSFIIAHESISSLEKDSLVKVIPINFNFFCTTRGDITTL